MLKKGDNNNYNLLVPYSCTKFNNCPYGNEVSILHAKKDLLNWLRSQHFHCAKTRKNFFGFYYAKDSIVTPETMECSAMKFTKLPFFSV